MHASIDLSRSRDELAGTRKKCEKYIESFVKIENS